MKTLVSIDWDFFLFRGDEAKKGLLDPWLFDWGHSEGQSAALQEILWYTRYSAFVNHEREPHEAAGFRTPMPDDFAAVLKIRSCRRPIVYMADSHAMGLPVLLEVAQEHGIVDVLHFDAHHDLGYSSQAVREEENQALASCGSWLYHGLENRFVDRVTVVYPDWREPEPIGDLEHLNEFRHEIAQTDWSSWIKHGREIDCAAIIVARSSAWTPPWYDRQFAAFVEQLPATELVCLDCTEMLGVTPGAHDACKPRRFDENEAKANAEALGKLMPRRP